MAIELEVDQFLSDESTETITRYPEGIGAGVPVSAIIEVGPEEFDSLEAAWIRRGTAYMSANETIGRADKYEIRGTTHRVESIQPPHGGVRIFTFIASRRTMNR